MPYGDKKGPRNEGPMTGRKLGFCVGNTRAGFEEDEANAHFNRAGRGFGRGRGMRNGMGMGRRFGRGEGMGFGYGKQSAEDERDDFNQEIYLKNKAKALKSELDKTVKALEDIKD